MRTARKLSGEEIQEQSVYLELTQTLIELHVSLIEYPAVVVKLGIISQQLDAARFASGAAMVGAHLGISGFPRIGKRLAMIALEHFGTTGDVELEGICRFHVAAAMSYSADFNEADTEFQKSLPLLMKTGSHMYAACSLHMRRHLYEAIASASAEVNAATQLIALARSSRDLRGLCWGQYDLAGSLARLGKIEDSMTSIELAHGTWKSLSLNLTTPIFFAQRSFVFLQASQYGLAQSSSDFSWRMAIRHLRIMDVSLRGLAWYLECVAGPHWASAPIPFDRRLVRSRCRWARLLAIMHIKIRPHLLRSRGRALVALGKKRKGTQSIEKAAKTARELGMKYDLAKALLDLAAVKETGRDQNRREAVALLKEMESVIPRAEAWLLGDQYDDAVVAPEFDLAAWEQQHGPITPTPEFVP
jgi:hypothetical protein